jgi:hypothetical protein
MASQLLPVPVQAHKQSRTQPSVHTLSLRAACIAFVAIVILFRWLHLIVSLQVASTDRQIQISTDQLAECERANAAVLYSIAEASSPRSFAQRAMELGYGPQTPAYVVSDLPILPEGEGSIASPLAEGILADLVTPISAEPEVHQGSTQAQVSP